VFYVFAKKPLLRNTEIFMASGFQGLA
jgi:hypothetical protein